ncbi:MAG TPA: response regulator transcription factor [Candidatus Paceibacterota bacterium]|jgi:two-component system OmpR family response regulator|nr:response regulator transcription factor [Candidatus Paceibacterota bacterium]
MRVLLLEDEKDIARFILEGLKAERLAVDWAETGEKGLMWAKVNSYDIGIFDIKLAGGQNGIQVCRTIRERGKNFPIIILSVTGDVSTKIEALNLGADDYLAKPFSLAELLARVRALLRRERKIVGPRLSLGDLEMDTQAHTVARAGKRIELNRKEFALLEYLMRNPGTTLTRAMILEHVWDMNADPFTNTVDVHIRFLREKIDIGHKKKLLKTVHGFGYKIEE